MIIPWLVPNTAKAFASLVAHQLMAVGSDLLEYSMSFELLTILTFLWPPEDSESRDLVGRTHSTPELVPMSKRSSWLLKQKIKGVKAVSWNQLIQWILSSSSRVNAMSGVWPFDKVATPNFPHDVNWQHLIELGDSTESTCSNLNRFTLRSVIVA